MCEANIKFCLYSSTATTPPVSNAFLIAFNYTYYLKAQLFLNRNNEYLHMKKMLYTTGQGVFILTTNSPKLMKIIPVFTKRI